MSASNYKPSLSLVLAHEGGYVNHPKDPGGATNKGVTQAVYDSYRKVKGLPPQTVKFITSDEVAEIYQKQYWRLAKGDDLPAGLDYAVFDFGVNSGVSRAARYLQRLVGVPDDGVIGNQTLAAVYEAARANEEMLILKYCANRLAFLKSLGTFPTFGKGWTRRVIGYKEGVQVDDTGVIDYAIKMAHADLAFTLPVEIGKKAEEVPAKAYAPIELKDSFPLATEADLAAIMSANDMLAAKIALSQIG